MTADDCAAELLAWYLERDHIVWRIPAYRWAGWGRTQVQSDARDVGRCLAEADHDEGGLAYDEAAIRDWLAEYEPSDAELRAAFAGYREVVDRYSVE